MTDLSKILGVTSSFGKFAKKYAFIQDEKHPFRHRTYNIPFDYQFKEVRKNERRSYKESLSFVFCNTKDITFEIKLINKTGLTGDVSFEYFFIGYDNKPLSIILDSNFSNLKEPSLNHIIYNKRGYKKFQWLMIKIFKEQFPNIYDGSFLFDEFEPNIIKSYIDFRVGLLKHKTGMSLLEYVRFCLGVGTIEKLTFEAKITDGL